MTTPQNETEKLNAFIGRWRTTGPIYENGAVIGQVNALDTYAWLPGNYAVIHYADSQMGDTKVHGIEIIGYDPARACFYCPFFDDQGSVGHETLRQEGKIWVWEGADVMGVKFHRCRAEFATADLIIAAHEFSDDGSTWKPWMDIQLKREK